LKISNVLETPGCLFTPFKSYRKIIGMLLMAQLYLLSKMETV